MRYHSVSLVSLFVILGIMLGTFIVVRLLVALHPGVKAMWVALFIVILALGLSALALGVVKMPWPSLLK